MVSWRKMIGRMQLWKGLSMLLALSGGSVSCSRAMKVAVVGSGNFGSVIARNIARNAALPGATFSEEVKMWVHDEYVGGKSLTDIINSEHKNVKYLPGFKLPKSVKAGKDVVEVCSDADVLFFVVPHQFLPGLLSTLKGKVKPSAIGVSMIKSIEFDQLGPKTCSEIIRSELNLQRMAVVMGANIAHDIAMEGYVESTVASADPDTASQVRRILEGHQFHTDTTTDVATVEYCGALKNVIAMGAGIAEGICATESSKAALIRQGLKEMSTFCREFDKTGAFQLETMFLSCGVADLIATCRGGRNSRCGASFTRELIQFHEKSAELVVIDDAPVADQMAVKDMWDKVVQVVCEGQHPPGVATCLQVMNCLLNKHGGQQGVFASYPLITRIHQIACAGHSPQKLFHWV